MSHSIKEGWLTKRGRVVKNWKKRYFVLTSQQLSYYQDASKKNVKGFLNLCKGDVVKEIRVKDRNYVFSVQILDRDLVMQSEGGSDMRAWIEALNSVVSRDINTLNTGASSSNSTTNIDLHIDDADSDDDQEEAGDVKALDNVATSSTTSSGARQAGKRDGWSDIEKDTHGDLDTVNLNSDDEDDDEDSELSRKLSPPPPLKPPCPPQSPQQQQQQQQHRAQDVVPQERRNEHDVDMSLLTSAAAAGLRLSEGVVAGAEDKLPKDDIETVVNDFEAAVEHYDSSRASKFSQDRRADEQNVFSEDNGTEARCNSYSAEQHKGGEVVASSSPQSERVAASEESTSETIVSRAEDAPSENNIHDLLEGESLELEVHTESNDEDDSEEVPGVVTNASTSSRDVATAEEEEGRRKAAIMTKSYKADSSASVSLQGYKGSLEEQQAEQQARLMSLKYSARREFGHEENTSAKKDTFDSAVHSQHERDAERARVLRDECMRDFGISAEEAEKHTRAPLFEKFLAEQQERESRRVVELREGTLKDFGIDPAGSSEKSVVSFEAALLQQKQRLNSKRESLRNETLEDFGIRGAGGAARRTSVADVAKQFGGSKRQLGFSAPVAAEVVEEHLHEECE